MEVRGNWFLAEGYPRSVEVLLPAFKAAGRDSAENALNADEDDTNIFLAVNVPWYYIGGFFFSSHCGYRISDIDGGCPISTIKGTWLKPKFS